MDYLFKGGHLYCPDSGLDEVADILVSNGVIQRIGLNLKVDDAEVYDCSGLWIAPGLVDIRTFCGELGEQHREDFTSLSSAALAGGFTDIVLGPWGVPCVDNPAVVTDLLARSSKYPVRFHCLGSLTKGMGGTEIAEMGLMKRAGVIGFCDGNNPIQDTVVLRRSLQYAERLHLPVFLTPSDAELRKEGVMHEGDVSTRIGLPGISKSSEIIGLQRIEALSVDTGVQSCALPVGNVPRTFSSQMVGVPARSLVLSDQDIETDLYNSSLHIIPPLQSDPDLLVTAVKEGVIRLIHSDHVPLTRVEKDCEFSCSVPGAMGLETALSVANSAINDLRIVWNAMCFTPAKLCGISKTLQQGANSDIIIFDPTYNWTPTKPYISKGINEPLEGRLLKGKVLATLVRGYFSKSAQGVFQSRENQSIE